MALRAGWAADTCDPDGTWDPANPGRGQCGPSALVIQDVLGGDLICAEVPEEYTSLPLGRMGRPEEIASVAAFFASEDSPYCTGAEIVVDGGWTVGTRRPVVSTDAVPT